MTAFFSLTNTGWLKNLGCALLILLSVHLGHARAAEGDQIGKTKKGVVIKVQAMPLAMLLQRIESETGIKFKFPGKMAAEPISAFLEAPDWYLALDELLDDMNHVDLWDHKNRLKTVRLIGMKAPVTASLVTAPTANTRPGNGQNPGQPGGNNNGVELTQAQLREISKGPYRSALPEKLYQNMEYRQFMEKHGIKSLEDMKNKRKAMRVRREARKQLRILRKREKQNQAQK